MYTIGIDVGSTFTDLVCSGAKGIWRAKAPTDPEDFSVGVLAACILDAEATRMSCAALGEAIGLGAHDVAYGIRKITLAEMAKAIRARLSTCGLDARKFVIVSFGDSCSLFAPWIPAL
jgi:N-methylhydantoinase A/oxoprolinase/acetone carboxylase beta subunit